MKSFIEKGILISISVLMLNLTNKNDNSNNFNEPTKPVELKKNRLLSINFDSINRVMDSLTYERILIAQQYQESKFKTNARSHVGALGIAQFMPSTWEWVKKKANLPPNASPTNPKHALKAQKFYMNYLLELPYIKGDISKALASYNCGHGRVKSLLKKYDDEWNLHLPSETKTYLTRIERWYNDTTLHSPFQETPQPMWRFTYAKENINFLP